MRLLLGIGNPGTRYKNTRHNAGFLFLDYLTSKYSISFLPSKNDYYYAEHVIGNNQFALIKPSQYVNNSGLSAIQALDQYQVSKEELLVIHDDIDLELGSVRVKISGGDGGHKGVSSIIYHLSSQEFSRIRIGVKDESFGKEDVADYVLKDFPPAAGKLLESVFTKCFLLSESFIYGGKKLLLDANSREN
ncbi:MAG: aminoacyl-tRNA hydrolase [Ignavibacteriaceae bacterium]|nr:aminoacyl-tRNA hydrolase [Ignavibacteriaceae bacterium]